MSTELGKAYVQIIPSAKGIAGSISKLLDPESKSAGESGGTSFANQFASVATKVIGALGIGKVISDSIGAGMTFDSSMSQVAATMNKSLKELEGEVGSVDLAWGTFSGNLREYAQEMGAHTAFSASEAADALNYMALAGYDTTKSMEMLPNVLNLAAAGNMDLARASDMVTDASSALGLETADTMKMVDQMARASSKSNTSVSQLGEAILTIGATARGVKGGTTELATVLGVLADNGIKGAEGGTHLRNMILSLQTPTKAGAEALEQLGMSYAQMYDEAGNMRALPEIFQEMQTKMEGMSQASKDAIISGIFNKTDLASANALIGTTSERFAELTAAIEDSAGAAQDMANIQLDNLEGDITLFKSALEGVQIAISAGVAPVLRKFVQVGTEGLSQLKTAFDTGDIMLAVESLGGILANGVQIIMSKVPEFLESGTQLLLNLAEGFKSKIPEFLSNALPMILDFTGEMRSNIGEMVDAGIDLIMSIMDGLIQALPDLIKYVPQIISDIAGVINDNLPKILKAGIDVILTLAKGIWDNRGEIWDNIGNIFQAAIDVIMAFNWLNFGKNVIEFLTNGIKSLFNNIPNALKEIGSRAVDLFKGIDWKGTGSQIINFILGGVRGLFNSIPNLLKEIGNSAVNLVKGIDWKGVGKAVIDGIVAGIKNFGGAISNTLMGFARNAWSSVKNFFGISSPSKLMRETIGKFIPLGLAAGIDDTGDSVHEAIMGIADDVIEDINLIDSDLDGIDDISTKKAVSVINKQNKDVNKSDQNIFKGIGDIIINVNPAPGMDERQLANYTIDELKRRMERDGWAIA